MHRVSALSRPMRTRLGRRLFSSDRTIVYTHTDEAPALATYALLPIIRRFVEPANIKVELSDISVSARVISQFPDKLTAAQKIGDTLGALGTLAKTPAANIIKLPNVSASVPQLIECIKELQSQGYALPDFPMNPSTAEEKDTAARYAKVLGSAVNPVLREGNSDRRVAQPVKDYAMSNPKILGDWSPQSKTCIAHMSDGDYFSSEQSTVFEKAGSVQIEMVMEDGSTKVLKPEVKLQAGEVIDSAVMRVKALRQFIEETLQQAKKDDVMISLHLKATMMKVSDPIMFGHVVEVFFKDVFEKHADLLAKCGVNSKLGLQAGLLEKLTSLSKSEQDAVNKTIEEVYANRPRLAMVDSDRGITNLHVPSDIIIDASMPNVVRDSGGMWNAKGELEDTVCIIPDRCYARVYQEMIADCKQNGKFDPRTMGNVANVGLMAQKAEEYGSHDKTFEVSSPGTVFVKNKDTGAVIFEQKVAKGDIFRMCQTKDAPIRDWVRLAVQRAKNSGSPAIFWLDEKRAHDATLIKLVNTYLKDHDTSGTEISIMAPVEAVQESMKRCRARKDTISVTGNVLRDYLTDLFPILELGTSAKMLSIVPMLSGGCMYETGAGGSAPKHVQQFTKEGHLRWDSLGEYLAMATSLEDLGNRTKDENVKKLGKTLTEATGQLLDNRKSPSRKVKELDNRGSSFYIAKYWADAMAKTDDSYKGLAKELNDNQEAILKEFIDCQGAPVDIGGYYKPDPVKAEKSMRPSAKFNGIIDGMMKNN